MIKRICFGIILMSISFVFAQTGVLSVEITGLNPVEGKLMLSLHNGPEGFPGDDTTRYKALISTVDQDSLMICLGSIPYGTYAIAIIHDLDGDGKLNSNFLGIPQEPVYFSNNVKPGFGPPKFKDASFVVDQEKLTIHIEAKE